MLCKNLILFSPPPIPPNSSLPLYLPKFMLFLFQKNKKKTKKKKIPLEQNKTKGSQKNREFILCWPGHKAYPGASLQLRNLMRSELSSTHIREAASYIDGNEHRPQQLGNGQRLRDFGALSPQWYPFVHRNQTNRLGLETASNRNRVSRLQWGWQLRHKSFYDGVEPSCWL